MEDSEERGGGLANGKPGMTDRELLLNLYATQFLVLFLAVILLHFQGRLSAGLFLWREGLFWAVGALLGMIVVGIEVLLVRVLPPEWLDDGGINLRLFRGRSLLHIAWIALLVSVAEEMLFRGAVQHWLGIWGTSFLFTLIHFRYLRRWAMLSLLFVVSAALGWAAEWSGTLTPAIVAHFIVDFVMGTLIRMGKIPGMDGPPDKA
jgi:membrane protease YdiL (CAAX protease family)